MIGQMAIAIALPGFNDLVRSVTPIFFFNGSPSVIIIFVLRENEKIYRLKV